MGRSFGFVEGGFGGHGCVSGKMSENSETWKLPAEIEARLGEGTYGPQRAIFEGGNLLLILHEPPTPNDSKRQAALILRKADGEWSAKDDADGAGKLRSLLKRYGDLLAECEQAYEVASSATDLFKLLERLAPLNRATTNLAAALQAAREACKDDKFLIGMRDQSNEVSRSFDLLTGDSRLALDYRIARNAEEQGERTDQMAEAQHKLNVLAAFTFPVMALATLLGMNLTHGLEERTPVLFWSVLASGVVLGFLVKAWVMKGKR